MKTATVTVKLPAQLYTRLQARAQKEHIDVIELLSRLVGTADAQPAAQQPTTQAFQRILERATDLGISDLAEQYAH